MNALVKHTDDPFAMLDQAIGVDMDGDLFRFNAKLGTYFEGHEKKIVPIGRKLKFAPLSIQDGYQKWIDGILSSGTIWATSPKMPNPRTFGASRSERLSGT